jgi:hypothetical protein
LNSAEPSWLPHWPTCTVTTDIRTCAAHTSAGAGIRALQARRHSLEGQKSGRLREADGGRRCPSYFPFRRRSRAFTMRSLRAIARSGALLQRGAAARSAVAALRLPPDLVLPRETGDWRGAHGARGARVRVGAATR